MKPTDVSAPVAAQEKRRMFDTSEVSKPSFWISQLCIIIATVLGVYLAAHQGFKQAIAYGDIQSDKNNYHLRKSLQHELAANIDLTRGYLKRIARGGIADRKAPFKLERFVWDCMKNSSYTLEMPSGLLRENNDFHRRVMELYDKIAIGDYSVQKGTELMEEILTHMEKDVIPAFEQNTGEIRTRLNAKGIAL
ncbi:hypothetical protein OH491_07870 [Termitidicoccus mucosus]|uniref:Uncharacterized protein n=1 Tax=Termitidicoccus mucosus TaxID=1184151 RepID=A0A178IFW1_9BACT|nr:hypothetical protein AW736_21175 [Opitutaceae bacterium TSB47]